MAKILRIIFIFAAFPILIGDSFQFTLKMDTLIVTQNGDTEKQDKTEKNKDSKEEKENKEEKEEKKNEEKTEKETEKDKHYSYELLLKSKLYSTQYALFRAALNYESRCRELESPPPEI